jgi:hypothetical protein
LITDAASELATMLFQIAINAEALLTATQTVLMRGAICCLFSAMFAQKKWSTLVVMSVIKLFSYPLSSKKSFAKEPAQVIKYLKKEDLRSFNLRSSL